MAFRETPIITAITLGLCAAFLGLEHQYKSTGRELPSWFSVFNTVGDHVVRIVQGGFIGSIVGVFLFSPLTAWVGLNSWYALGLGAVIGAIAGYFSKFLP